MRETSKVFNRIPLLALVHNRTRQNDDGTSLQKQTSNDKRQSNWTKLAIAMSFVSEKVLLFDPKSFRRQECSLTLWSRNQHIAWFYVFRVLLSLEFPASRVNICPKKTLRHLSYIRNFLEFWIMAHGEQRGFLHRHFFVTEESTLLFRMAKSF